MVNKLSDGSVISSNLSMKPLMDAKQQIMGNYSLKVGIVTDILYPDEEKNLSKKFIEYNVMASELQMNGNMNMTVYRNCTVQNAFGMSNNNLTYTLQIDKSEDGRMEFGSLVLLLCISGQSTNGQAVIIGGFSHPDNPKYTKEDGQFYDFNFNGINYNINKDGEWTLTFNSPLDSQKKKANEQASGTQIKIDKDGRIKISDNEGQFWELDRTNKTSTWSNKSISLASSGDVNEQSKGKTNLSSDDNMSLSSQKDVNIAANSNMSLSANSNMNQSTSGSWQVKASGNAQIQAGGNASIQGGAIAELKGTTVLLADGSVPAAGVGISQVIGICSGPGGPLSGGAIITGSSTVLIGS